MDLHVTFVRTRKDYPPVPCDDVTVCATSVNTVETSCYVLVLLNACVTVRCACGVVMKMFSAVSRVFLLEQGHEGQQRERDGFTESNEKISFSRSFQGAGGLGCVHQHTFLVTEMCNNMSWSFPFDGRDHFLMSKRKRKNRSRNEQKD